MEMQTTPEIANAWQKLGDPAPNDLKDARLQTHWATQIISTAGRTHLETKSDDSHTNLGWDEAHGALAGREVGGYQAALRLADLTLLLLDGEKKIVAEQALDGLTLDEGYAWLEQALKEHAGLEGTLERPTYDMPEHPVSQGSPLQLDPAAGAELTRWYSNADLILQKIAAEEPEATEVRCWPHHFDIATLIIEKEGDEENMVSIGIGLSPGDSNYDEPYWYCQPWPAPQYLERPMLHGEGFWHSENWVGGVLTATRQITAEPLDAQARRAELFVRSAISGSRTLLEGKFAKL